MGGVKSCLADFNVPFAPHFGVCLELNSNPTLFNNCVLVMPDLPKKIKEMDKGTLYDNSLQNKPKPKNKLEHKKLIAAKSAELFDRKQDEGKRFDKCFMEEVSEK